MYKGDTTTNLYKIVDALCGDGGAGDLTKQYFLARLSNALETIYFNDLDYIFGNVSFLARSPAETYTFNPLIDMLTSDQWDEVKVKDAWYRARVKDFFIACNMGGTPDGIRMCVQAAIAVDCDLFEIWRYCADEETEILTQSGYRRHDELNEGDEVLTLNMATGLAEWQPVLAINTFPVTNEPMLSVEMGRRHSSLTTLDHRWPVQRRVRREDGIRRYSDISIRRSHELSTEDRFIRAAAVANLPDQPKYTDSLVELVGWFVTEGHIHTNPQGGRYTGLNICQSHKVNPTKVDRIRSALTKTFGQGVQTFTTRTGKRADRAAQWRESVAPSKPDITLFRLNTVAGEVLCRLAPNKVASMDFINSLTEAQLRIFLDACLAGDGHTRKDGYRSICQNSLDRLIPIQIAATLLGIPTSLQAPQTTGHCRPTHVLSFSEKSRFVTPLGQGRKNANHIRYTGTVWCPSTPNGTWFARRRGTTYFTGNTDNFGLTADLGRATARNEVVVRPHKASLAPVEFRLLRDMLDKLKPADVIVTINLNGLAVSSPISVNAATADSTYYEVQKVVTGTPALTTLPPPELLAIDLDPTERWLFSDSPELAPYAAFNITSEYSFYYLMGGGGRSPIDAVSYGTLQPDGSVKSEPNFEIYKTTSQFTAWQEYPKADSPDNYPGGKFGQHPGYEPAVNGDSSPYLFSYTSQLDFVTQKQAQVQAVGGEADDHRFRLPIQGEITSKITYTPEKAIAYTTPAKDSTVTTSWTSYRKRTSIYDLRNQLPAMIRSGQQ